MLKIFLGLIGLAMIIVAVVFVFLTSRKVAIDPEDKKRLEIAGFLASGGGVVMMIGVFMGQ